LSKIKTAKGSYIEDITGQTFNRLTVLELTDKKNNDNRWLWKCQCSCGNIVYVSMHQLRAKKYGTKSCGCLQREWAVKKNKMGTIDLTGQRYGMLTVIRDLGTINKIHYWECKCDCGNITRVSVNDLRRDLYGDKTRHGTYSCGCLSKSVGEKKVKTQLELLQIKFKREKTFKDCINPKTGRKLRFDFYLQDYNCCIEYDGFTHFVASGGWNTEENLAGIQYRDNIKNTFCKDNNIRLVRIPYTDFNGIDTDYILSRIGDKIEQ
jgi:hypothetical protein